MSSARKGEKGREPVRAGPCARPASRILCGPPGIMIIPATTHASTRRNPLARLAFVTTWATGTDPARDGIFRLCALRAAEESGEWETFELFCDPFTDEDDAEREAVWTRIEREFGIERAVCEDAPSAADAWDELLAFLDGSAVIASDALVFESWFEHFAKRRGGGAA